MQYRIAEKRDVPGVLKLYTQLFAQSARQQPAYWQPAQADPKFLEKVIRSGDGDILVAEEDGFIAGFALVQEKITQPFACMIPHRYAYLMDLAVDEGYRGNGIGGQLMDRVERWAELRELDYLELNVLEENPDARRLYERKGYRTAMRTMKYPLRPI